MIKTFCDHCGQEATTPSRRFEDLSVGEGGCQVGLEVILLCSGDQKAQRHICDECLPALLIKAAKSFPAAAVIKKQADSLSRAYQTERRHQNLEAKEANLASREAALKARESDLTELDALRVKVKSLSATMEQTIRREVAARVQADADIRENPSLGSRVRIAR